VSCAAATSDPLPSCHRRSAKGPSERSLGCVTELAQVRGDLALATIRLLAIQQPASVASSSRRQLSLHLETAGTPGSDHGRALNVQCRHPSTLRTVGVKTARVAETPLEPNDLTHRHALLEHITGNAKTRNTGTRPCFQQNTAYCDEAAFAPSAVEFLSVSCKFCG
jgi:hypothetical protein